MSTLSKLARPCCQNSSQQSYSTQTSSSLSKASKSKKTNPASKAARIVRRTKSPGFQSKKRPFFASSQAQKRVQVHPIKVCIEKRPFLRPKRPFLRHFRPVFKLSGIPRCMLSKFTSESSSVAVKTPVHIQIESSSVAVKSNPNRPAQVPQEVDLAEVQILVLQTFRLFQRTVQDGHVCYRSIHRPSRQFSFACKQRLSEPKSKVRSLLSSEASD